MKNLKSIQINDRATHDLQLYRDGLRNDQLIYLNPCAGMPIETAKLTVDNKRLILAGI